MYMQLHLHVRANSPLCQTGQKSTAGRAEKAVATGRKKAFEKSPRRMAWNGSLLPRCKQSASMSSVITVQASKQTAEKVKSVYRNITFRV